MEDDNLPNDRILRQNVVPVLRSWAGFFFSARSHGTELSINALRLTTRYGTLDATRQFPGYRVELRNRLHGSLGPKIVSVHPCTRPGTGIR